MANESVRSPTLSAWQNVQGIFLLVFTPWLFFAVTATLYTFSYYQSGALVYMFVACFMLVSLIFVAANSHKKLERTQFWLFLGILTGISTLAGLAAGWYNYQANMVRYWAYDEGRVYTNVLPGTPGASFGDAAALIFSSDSTVDVTKSVGYQGSSLYCVAPILNTQPTSSVSFWAVGTNCCDKRGGFTCGDAGKKGVHGGAVYLEAGSFLPSLIPEYTAAAKEAAAFDNLPLGKNLVFVEWMADPLAAQNSAWSSATLFLAVVLLIWFAHTTMLALCIYWGAGKSAA